MKTTVTTPVAMRLKNKFLQKMCYLLVLFSGMAYAQPAINNPTPYEVCEGNIYFNLHTKDVEIVNGNTNLVVTYYMDAAFASIISNPNNFYNIDSQLTIYVKVVDPAEPNNPSFTTLSLVVNPKPFAYQAPVLIQTNSIPTAVFDLTSQTSIIIGNQTGLNVNYYFTSADAQAGLNSLPNSYTNVSNPQIIYAREENATTGCYSITSFQLLVNPFQINQPTPYLVCEDDNDGISCEYILGSKDSEISTQPGIQITYHFSLTESLAGANPIPKNTPYCNLYNTQTIYARVLDPSLPSVISSTFFKLIIKLKPNFTIENTNICNGALATITAVNNGNIGSFSYVWTIPVAATNPGNVPSFTTSIPGVYDLLITDLTSTCTKSLSTTVSSLANTSPTFSIPTTLCLGSITALPTTSDNGITGHWSPALTVGTNDYTFTPYVGQCSSGFMTSITVIATPTANQAPNLIVSDSPTYDGFATFNLTTQNGIINTNPSIVIEYFPSSIDAQNNTILIANPSTYTNITNPQTIGVRVINTVTGCYSITSFQLIVTDPNIVYIPDPIFKAKLLAANVTIDTVRDDFQNNIVVDINNDGEIQVSEALLIYELRVSGSYNLNGVIHDLTGIESFSNLKSLLCGYNQLTSINVSNNIALTNLECGGNLLTSLDFTNNVNLQDLSCSDNQITNLDFTYNLNLAILNCGYNQLTSLDFTHNLNFEFLTCNNNLLTSINVTHNTNLGILNCSSNLLTGLDVSHNLSLQNFECDNNLLTSLDVNNNVNLQTLKCNNNQISSLNLTALPNLNLLNCSNNDLQTLDLSQNHLLANLYCNNNPLNSLFLKNGIDENIVGFPNSPSLAFVCCDESQSSVIHYSLISGGFPNTVVNSYCSFTPGGNHNTISGAIKFDANNNGCDASDLPQPNIRININEGTTQGATFTNNTGNYNFYTPAGSFNLTPDVENPTWFNFSPTTATIPFADANNNSTTQDFCLSASGTHTDVEVVIEPITPARPGFNAVYKIVYKNKGNQMVSANVSFNYNDAVLDFVTATVTPSFQATGILNFGFSNLLPFENRSFYITLHVNAPTNTPAVNIGDVLNFTAAILNIGDENPSDNTFVYNQTVVGSYDPNSITCMEGASVPTSQIGNFLHYGVNFENTGNYPAENIVVKTIIDTTKYDINSLQMLNTSNPAYTRITGNVVEFIFNHIMLDSGGHGDVLFKIRTLNSLVNGDMVSRAADIFFDYNAPVATGMANTTFQTLNNGQFVLDNSIVVSPNPTSSIVNITGSSAIKSIQVYDIQGRLLETKLVEDVTTTINLSDKTNGIYFFKITTENGSKVEKIIKE